MGEQFTDEQIRQLTQGALQLYAGFDEVFHGHIVEAVMRHLPPDFDRRRVERVVSEYIH